MRILRAPLGAARVCRGLPRPLVLVPTMGALHEGHLSLIRRARRRAGRGGTVVVSIFVNPSQFGPREDLSRYPRPLRRDLALCRAEGVDAVFLPPASAMYPPDYSTWVEETALAGTLCGRARPGHFRGVCTVVAKLFHVIAPDEAVFGEKDWQQLAVIRRMVRDLDWPVRVVSAPTVRERDGLALSSRNRYLTPEERRQAPVLRAALLAARRRGRAAGPAALRRLVLARLRGASLARPDYVEVVDADTLEPARSSTRRLLAAVAVFFGRTRLIDNILVP
jgi:pantoate--beta-alanine ligase